MIKTASQGYNSAFCFLDKITFCHGIICRSIIYRRVNCCSIKCCGIICHSLRIIGRGIMGQQYNLQASWIGITIYNAFNNNITDINLASNPIATDTLPSQNKHLL